MGEEQQWAAVAGFANNLIECELSDKADQVCIGRAVFQPDRTENIPDWKVLLVGLDVHEVAARVDFMWWLRFRGWTAEYVAALFQTSEDVVTALLATRKPIPVSQETDTVSMRRLERLVARARSSR